MDLNHSVKVLIAEKNIIVCNFYLFFRLILNKGRYLTKRNLFEEYKMEDFKKMKISEEKETDGIGSMEKMASLPINQGMSSPQSLGYEGGRGKQLADLFGGGGLDKRNEKASIEMTCSKESKVDVGHNGMSQDISKKNYKKEIGKLWKRVTNLEEQLNAMQNNNEKVERCYDSYNSKAISRSQMATWIIEAIKQGNRDFGVSKSYLKKYLSEVNGMPNNAYYIRKLNTVLTLGIDEKRLMFDKVHSLYKLV